MIPLIILAFVIILLILCFALYKSIKKVKRGWIWLLTIIMIMVGGIKIHDRVVNSVFYDFKDKMCNIYPEIKKIKLQIGSGGTSCIIEVYIQKEIDNEKVEDIFIEMMKGFNQEPMSSYLLGDTNLKNKSWVSLYILFYGSEQGSFYSERYQHNEWFTNENKKDQTWKNSYTGKTYRYSDYIN
ncbi:hypothetical protein ACOAOT_14870 [Lacrimispora sp. AGF001]|uniref:hypothetical protein n=1 Tax=Lacrimispora sp. AGF001 TaxID=3401631 RepID=UPI003B42F059